VTTCHRCRQDQTSKRTVLCPIHDPDSEQNRKRREEAVAVRDALDEANKLLCARWNQIQAAKKYNRAVSDALNQIMAARKEFERACDEAATASDAMSNLSHGVNALPHCSRCDELKAEVERLKDANEHLAKRVEERGEEVERLRHLDAQVDRLVKQRDASQRQLSVAAAVVEAVRPAILAGPANPVWRQRLAAYDAALQGGFATCGEPQTPEVSRAAKKEQGDGDIRQK
jgi:chromosome segregation ATPase